jgi:hypothetical protein
MWQDVVELYFGRDAFACRDCFKLRRTGKHSWRFWVCPGCGRVYIINVIPAQKIDGVRLSIGKQEFLLDVTNLGEPVCMCGRPIGETCLKVSGLMINSL